MVIEGCAGSVRRLPVAFVVSVGFVLVALRLRSGPVLRSLVAGVAFAALVAGASLQQAAAQGAPATVRGTELNNYGRIVITLPTAQKVNARVTNGVLVVNFSEPVAISAERMVREMPAYLSVGRVDPDGRGMRFALTRPYNPNVMEAGERIFIDLIPENWQGMLPGLPQEVVEELAKRARAAELVARDLQRSREQTEPRAIDVKASTLPTLSRLIFDIPGSLPLDHSFEKGVFDLVVNAPLKIEPSRLRSILPDDVKLESAETAGGRLRIRLAIPERYAVKGFREDDGFIIDMATRGRAAGSPEATIAAPPEPAPRARAAEARPADAPAAQPAPRRELPAATPAPEPRQAAAAQSAAPQPIGVSGSGQGDNARLDFAFPRATAAAAFQDRGEFVIVFDTVDQLDAQQVAAALPALVAGASATKEGKATVLRMQLKDAAIIRFAPDGLRWSLTTGDKGVAPAEPLSARRGIDEGGQTILSLPLANVSGVHWIGADAGQPYAVVTAFGPGGATPKPQRFVEFQLEQTAQGVAVRPFADDVIVRVGVGDVIISRGAGLAVSLVNDGPQTPEGQQKAQLVPDRAEWTQMRLGSTRQQLQELTRRAAEAARSERSNARMRLATFNLANGFAAEALGPLNAVIADDVNFRTDRRAHVMRAMAQTMLFRASDAERTLAAEHLKEDPEAALWRAVTDARQGRFPRALAGFRRAAEIVDAYPDQLQAIIRPEVARAAIAMRDQGVAERELKLLADLAPTWLPRDEVTLLRAQLDEVTGRPEAALTAYKGLFDSIHRPIAARAQLRGVQLAHREDDKSIKPEEAQARLETVSVIWRGDDVEIEAIGELGAMYADQKLWREAFGVARRASGAFPDHPITRKLHDETARQFEELFTQGKADELPRVDALALFYDFKEFLPIGRRGDEIIRRLADRLVELDLLDQAAELLQHQIDNRLTGAARATVATRLAMIRLMSNKPADALRALASTRLPELPRDVKRARQLLEAKALSDLSRTDLALEMLAAERGAEVDRLRADILWSARRWREAGEAHERILGESWRGPHALDERERADALRAAVAYVMANEALSLDRLRAKFAAPMAQTPDARVFAFVTGANRARSGDVRELARTVAGSDTLMEFMAEYRKRYPDYASTLRSRQRPAEGAQAPGQQGQPQPGQPLPGQTPSPAPGQPPQPAAAAPQAQPQRQG
jgi:tetratricopeptide (TPR) repeat protein